MKDAKSEIHRAGWQSWGLSCLVFNLRANFAFFLLIYPILFHSLKRRSSPLQTPWWTESRGDVYPVARGCFVCACVLPTVWEIVLDHGARICTPRSTWLLVSGGLPTISVHLCRQPSFPGSPPPFPLGFYLLSAALVFLTPGPSLSLPQVTRWPGCPPEGPCRCWPLEPPDTSMWGGCCCSISQREEDPGARSRK